MEQESEGMQKQWNFPPIDLSQPFPPWPEHWGRWKLDAEQLVLRHEEDYPLDLKRFSTAAPMLDMIVQVRTRGS
jgi:hypothetical protein